MNEASRYSKGTAVTVPHPIEGFVQAVHLSPLRWSRYPYTRVQVSAPESFASMAWRAYANAQDYWFIAAMNPDVTHPLDLEPGHIVQLPTGKMW